ncbi:MAG: hypothetical protein NTY77_09365 [Elusimicrobia bacterium]|nr:hypothetical protein [Elusimicrobiota bacterium]
MDQKPKIPTLKDSQKPQVRIKGLAARLSLVERIKQFKKKDLAFILAGLGVLFMAPLAEHFMMSPENAGDGTFKPGWDFMNKGGRFGDGSSPFEPGVNGMAPGSFAGSGGDVITPLNVRDPSALVMGPGAAQQPAATATAAAPAAKENTDWKDAIANAASKGASAATKAASLPVPKPALTNAGLRGLSAGSGGGGGASWAPPPINAHAPNTAAQSNSLGYVSKMPGYAGVGAHSPTGGSASSLAALKKAADNAGNALNRQGSAVNAAEQAAGMNMPTGSGGGIGEGGSGKDDKGGSGNGNKDSKSLGESLAFLAAKENQQKAIDLYWKLKEKEAMLWPDLKQKMLEEAVMTPFKALTAGIADAVKQIGSDAPGTSYYQCDGGKNFPSSTKTCGKDVTGACCQFSQGTLYICFDAYSPPIPQGGYSCSKQKGDASDAKPKAEVAPNNANVPGTDPTKPRTSVPGGMTGNYDKLCNDMAAAQDETYKAVSQPVARAYAAVMAANNAMSGNVKSVQCGQATVENFVPEGNIAGRLTKSNQDYVKAGYLKLTDADNLLQKNIEALKTGETNKVKEDVTNKLDGTTPPQPTTVAEANTLLTNTIKPAVAGWKDPELCAGCADNDGKVTEAQKQAQKQFAAGIPEVQKTQDQIDKVIAALNKAKGDTKEARGALSGVPASGKKLEGCGTDAKGCFEKYIKSAEGGITDALQQACGNPDCTPKDSKAAGGLQKTANLQMDALKKGGGEPAKSNEVALSQTLQGYVNYGRGLSNEGLAGDKNVGLVKLQENVASKLEEIPATPPVADLKAKLGEIATAVNGERDLATAGYDGAVSQKTTADLQRLGTESLCGGSSTSDACVPGGATAKVK